MDDLIDTLVLPTERPPLALDIKRSLLTFDRVNLCSPDDRELVNPVNFMTATMPIALPFAFGWGSPVLPLGKVPGYDDAFSDTLKECESAVQQQSVVIRKSPELMTQGVVLLGAAPNPDGWAPANWVMGVFRSLVSQRDVLLAACRGLPPEATLRRLDLDSLAPGGVALTQGFGGPPSVADLNDGSLAPELVPLVQRLASTRLGALVKCVGLCENTGLHPSSNDTGMISLLEHFQQAAGSSLAAALQGRSEQDLVQRALRVERVIFSHQLPDNILASLSVQDILKLRTTAWGRAGKARAEFFAAVRRFADECPDDTDFERAVRDAIESYNAARADLVDEWKKLGAKVGIPALTGAATAIGNVLQNLLGMPGWSVALGVTAAGAALTGVVDEVVTIFRNRSDLSSHPGKALVGPYQFALRD